MTEAILPCRSCRAEAGPIVFARHGETWVQCLRCGSFGPNCRPAPGIDVFLDRLSRARAVAGWNELQREPAPQGLKP